MRLLLGKFIIIAALVLTSISVCFPNDGECVEYDCQSSTQLSTKAKAAKSSEQSENHHCICSMVCHSMFINFKVTSLESKTLIVTTNNFHFTTVHYPLVIISLDKPPIV